MDSEILLIEVVRIRGGAGGPLIGFYANLGPGYYAVWKVGDDPSSAKFFKNHMEVMDYFTSDESLSSKNDTSSGLSLVNRGKSSNEVNEMKDKLKKMSLLEVKVLMKNNNIPFKDGPGVNPGVLKMRALNSVYAYAKKNSIKW